jgi:hypothetical protein
VKLGLTKVEDEVYELGRALFEGQWTHAGDERKVLNRENTLLLNLEGNHANKQGSNLV